MAIVAGIDFGTQSVRVTLVDGVAGRLGSGTGEYPVLRSPDDPRRATQRPADQLAALRAAMLAALGEAGLAGDQVAALAVATTGSTVVPVGANLEPLGDLILWCDHRAAAEAEVWTAEARRVELPALEWAGGRCLTEMGWPKLLAWLRRHPELQPQVAAILENCDWIVATLIGTRRVKDLPRSRCALGHKWLWREQEGGLPPLAVLSAVDPLLEGAPAWLAGRPGRSDQVAGLLCTQWAGELGLRAEIPVTFGMLDAHADGVGVGIAEGDVVNIVGTSSCILAVVDKGRPIPGIFGVAPDSILPGSFGIEAGLSAAGELLEVIARRAGRTVADVAAGIQSKRVGETGLLRLVWDHGDRTILGNDQLAGVTLGWRLHHTVEDEFFAAIEGLALHTRIILDWLVEHGVPLRRVIMGGGIPRQNEVLNQVYANLLGCPVLVPEGSTTGLGSAMFALVAAGEFADVQAAQQQLVPAHRLVSPQPETRAAANTLYGFYRQLYFSLGSDLSPPLSLGGMIPTLRELSRSVRSRP